MSGNNCITPVILAGGSGTRLWPLSRKNFPKQFHLFKNTKTMIQLTVLRLRKLKTNDPIIICNNEHRFIVEEQMSQIKTKCTILVEPVPKSTAPAIAIASFFVNLDTPLLVLSADHFIEDEELFQKQVLNSLDYVNKNNIVVFGVKPEAPNTNYGYINVTNDKKFGFKVSKFVEKPSYDKAIKYQKNKNYFWNSGIFFFKPSVFLDELNKFSPRIYDACKNTGLTAYKDLNFYRFDKKIFEECPENSIDYAVMENTKKAVMVPLLSKWSDIGSWRSLFDNLEKDKNGNVLSGDIVCQKVDRSLIFSSSDRLIVTNHLKDIILVDTKDVLFISSKESTENIKPFLNKFMDTKDEIFSNHLEVHRPWGNFESIKKEKNYQVKKIRVKPGGKLSLQKHRHRSEHWVVVSGEAEVTKGKEKFRLQTNESIYIPKETKHSLENLKNDDLILIEIQTGTYLGEDDIQRFEDVYNRN